MNRAREVGIRKVIGSSRYQLIRQFLSESFLINFFALAVALLINHISLPYFRELTGKSLNAPLWSDLSMYIKVGLLFLLGTFLSGIYPAFVLSSYKPIQVLKGKIQYSLSGIGLRKALVVFQFTVSIALIAGTMVVQQQLHYMREKDMGMNIEQVLVVKGPAVRDSAYQENWRFLKPYLQVVMALAR